MEREPVSVRSLQTGVFVRRSVRVFARAYAVTFGVRAALALLQRLFAALRSRKLTPVRW
jgi:hypothetical protein